MEDILIVLVCAVFAAGIAVILVYNRLSRVDFWIARLWKDNDNRIQRWSAAAAKAAIGMDADRASQAAELERLCSSTRTGVKKRAEAISELADISRIPENCGCFEADTLEAMEDMEHWEGLLLDCVCTYRSDTEPYNNKLSRGFTGFVGRRVLHMRPYPPIEFWSKNE